MQALKAGVDHRRRIRESRLDEGSNRAVAVEVEPEQVLELDEMPAVLIVDGVDVHTVENTPPKRFDDGTEPALIEMPERATAEDAHRHTRALFVQKCSRVVVFRRSVPGKQVDVLERHRRDHGGLWQDLGDVGKQRPRVRPDVVPARVGKAVDGYALVLDVQAPVDLAIRLVPDKIKRRHRRRGRLFPGS